jgi:hypothetical protein
MSSTIKMEREDGGRDAYQCDNCGRVWTFDQLDGISDLGERVSPGGEVPAGECPDPDETCGGALCYPVAEREGHAMKSPEQWHSDLMEAIDYELDNYGPASLAEMIASIIDPRADHEDHANPHHEQAAYWLAVRKQFEDLAARLPARPARHPQPCSRCGHQCPSDGRCATCGGDPMEYGDTLCVECDRNTRDNPDTSN